GLDSFMRAKDFKGINVTIPYKEDVIKYLDFVDERARAIGAVNTVVNKDGSISKTNRASVRSLDEFDILMKYIDYLLEDTGHRILSGDIAARPYRMADGTQACQYCAYQLLCGFEPELPGYACREIKKLGDEEIMDGMALKQQPDELQGKERQ
ncbi:MAG: PD-(D/E)XK nuclease family protein, partial [Selenomonadaceae bacterium]|nr:PD-(D/E)XK nuclease family protein [Selenomonadaceae bacterium]